VEFDSHFLDFVTEDDAVSVAQRVVNAKVHQIQIKELAMDFPEWSPRRLNSALNYLERERLIQPFHAIATQPYVMAFLTVTDYTRRFARENS
jgi:hypothetical protein